MHGNTLLVSAATIAVAAALPQIVTTVTQPTTSSYTPGYSFGFPGYGGYNSGYRSYRGYGSGYGSGSGYLNGLYNNYGSSYGGYGSGSYNPYNAVVGSASLGFLPGAIGSQTTVDGYTGYAGYQAPYVYAFPGDTKRVEADAASVQVADSKTTLSKRQYFGPLGNAIASGWENFLDSIGIDTDKTTTNVGSASLGLGVPSFTIDSGYPAAPAYPQQAYPGAGYAAPLGYPVAAPGYNSYAAPLDV